MGPEIKVNIPGGGGHQGMFHVTAAATLEGGSHAKPSSAPGKNAADLMDVWLVNVSLAHLFTESQAVLDLFPIFIQMV